MRAIMSRSVWATLAIFVLVGCPKESDTEESSDDTGSAANAKSTTTATATPPPTVKTLTPDDGSDPSITPRAKAELDGKDPTAAGGATLKATTKVSFGVPSDWKNAKSGDFQTSIANDDKARFAAGDAKGDAVGTREKAAAAIGLTGCKWNPTDSISMGKKKLATSVADGLCKRGTTEVATVFADVEGIVAVGGWDTGGGADQKLFDVFRNVAAAGGGGRPGGLGPCCSALAQNAKSAPPNQVGGYLAAAAMCRSLMSSSQGRAALGQVRAALRGANAPSSCL